MVSRTPAHVVSAAGEPDSEGGWAWPIQGGDCVFSVFHDDSDYFPNDRQVMLNLKVDGLDALAERLESEGVRVERRDEWEVPQLGNFARIHDCDGNPIELWEPAEKRSGN